MNSVSACARHRVELRGQNTASSSQAQKTPPSAGGFNRRGYAENRMTSALPLTAYRLQARIRIDLVGVPVQFVGMEGAYGDPVKVPQALPNLGNRIMECLHLVVGLLLALDAIVKKPHPGSAFHSETDSLGEARWYVSVTFRSVCFPVALQKQVAALLECREIIVVMQLGILCLLASCRPAAESTGQEENTIAVEMEDPNPAEIEAAGREEE